MVQVDPPPSEVTNKTVFNNDQTANAAMIALYSQIAGGGLSYQYLGINTGLLTDELVDYTSYTESQQFYSNSVLATNSQIDNTWKELYKIIYGCNSILENLGNSTGMSDGFKDQLRAEGLFTRSFCYFYLTQLFGDVPFVESSNYLETANLKRQNKDTILNSILRDLVMSRRIISAQYLSADGKNVTDLHIRPSKAVVDFLLSKIYLYRGSYEEAIKYADSVFIGYPAGLEDDLNKVFLAGSQEAIWQVVVGSTYFNTWEGINYILTGYPSLVALNEQFVARFSPSDKRLGDWVNYYYDEGTANKFYYPYKYKVSYSSDISEYVTVFRLAELYLIRAEASANLNEVELALNDINEIRTRAGLSDTAIDNKEGLLKEILEERSKELFTEWGNRWFDALRFDKSGKIMENIAQSKNSIWHNYQSLFPIPQTQISMNRGLIQNEGY